MPEQDRSPPARADLLVAALIASFIAFFLVGIAGVIYFGYNATRQTTTNKALSASQVVSANVEWILEVSRQVLQRVDDYGGPEMDAVPSAALNQIEQAVMTMPGSPRVYLVGADGKTRLTNDPDFKPIDIRDRPYFKALEQGQNFYVSPLLVSRLNKSQIFVVSRRIERNGAFAGGAMISYDTSLIKGIWQSLQLDDSSKVSIVRTDGEIVSQYPLPPGPQNLGDSPLFKTHLPLFPAGSYEATSVTDSEHHIVAYSKIEGTDLIAVASIGYEAAFARFNRFVALLLAVAIPIALLLAGLTVYSYRRLAADEKKRQQLASALEENRMLFREIHHRVKNNLQSVISLIRLQVMEPDVKTAMTDRVQAMVAVHEQIYGGNQFSTVDASKYIRSISDKVAEGYGKHVTMHYALDPVEIDRDKAMPLGLIVNEVVSNAVKYAFGDSSAGDIFVEFSKTDDEHAVLRIRDNGVGFDPKDVSEGMGSKLIRGFTSQLQGEMEFETGKGTSFVAKFPLRMAA